MVILLYPVAKEMCRCSQSWQIDLVIHDARVPYLGRSSGAGLDVDRTSCTLLTMLLVHHQYLGIRALVP